MYLSELYQLYLKMATNSIPQPEIFRANMRLKFDELLHQTPSELSDIDLDKMATNIEISVYNYAIQEAKFRKIVRKWENHSFIQLYIDRLRSVYVNLKNPELIQGVLTGEITPQNIGFMTHQEFNPAHWKEAIERKIKRNESKYNTKMEASTDMFTCSKCKSKRCTYYELQTRSADEPATVFITCLDCGKHWKS